MMELLNSLLLLIKDIFIFITNKRKPKFIAKNIKISYVPLNLVNIKIDLIVKNLRKTKLNLYDLNLVLQGEEEYEEKYRLYDLDEIPSGTISFGNTYLEQIRINGNDEKMFHLKASFLMKNESQKVKDIFLEYRIFSHVHRYKIYTFKERLIDEIKRRDNVADFPFH